MTALIAVALMGPSAMGKTALSFVLAEHFEIEIISVDSALVYRGMDIGTAKPDSVMQQQIPHHLIDIRDVHEPYSVADFRQQALQLIQEINSRQKIPLLVGGTMLYFNILRQGISTLPVGDESIRRQLEAEKKLHDKGYLHRRLGKVDPEMAARLHPNDSQRIQRALEVYLSSGKPLSQWQQENQPMRSALNLLEIGLVPENRAWLHQRLEIRLQAMMADGFIDEVNALIQRPGVDERLPAMRSVGYRQVLQYLNGSCDYATMLEKVLIANRQLVKRQLTWLRRWPGLVVINADQQNQILNGESTGIDVEKKLIELIKAKVDYD